jgi:hypothetical protein
MRKITNVDLAKIESRVAQLRDAGVTSKSDAVRDHNPNCNGGCGYTAVGNAE